MASLVLIALISGMLSACGVTKVDNELANNSCAACHGVNGISPSPVYPNLAGLKAAYTVKQLKAFKSGERQDPVMSAMAKPLSDEEIEILAAFYAGLGN